MKSIEIKIPRIKESPADITYIPDFKTPDNKGEHHSGISEILDKLPINKKHSPNAKVFRFTCASEHELSLAEQLASKLCSKNTNLLIIIEADATEGPFCF